MDAQTNTVMMKALTFKKMGVLNEKRCKKSIAKKYNKRKSI